MNTNQLRKYDRFVRIYKKAAKIEKALSRLDTAACNYELSEAQEKRGDRLFAQADDLAQLVGLRAYYQSDPRGCALYFVPKLKDADRNYSTEGMAIYE